MSAAKSAIHVSITGDAKVLNAAFATASTGASRFQAKMATASAGMAKMALPIAGIAIASGKLAVDFESSMSKIVGLVGLTAAEVDGMKGSVLALAGRTAQAPKDLADAMFFITSAGLRGTDALEALEVAAKASSAGLGDMTGIADALTSAMNAYGAENLSAAEAGDILVATVREGKIEAESLAGSLGKVIPAAAQMGVEFEQVGASLAAMSRIGINVEEGTTALAGFFTAMIKPSDDGIKALEEVGLSMTILRDTIREDGPLVAIQLLSEAFDGNLDQMVRVIPKARAFKGALALLADEGKAANTIFENMVVNTGDVDTAFDVAAKTGALKLKQAVSDIKVAGVNMGEVLIPIIADLAGELSDAAQSFSNLDEQRQKNIVNAGLYYVGLAAAVGITSKLARAVTGLKKGYDGIKFGVLATRVALFGKAIAVISGTFIAASAAWVAFTIGSDFKKVFEEGEESALGFGDSIAYVAAEQIPGLGLALDLIRGGLADAGAEANTAAEGVDNLGASAGNMGANWQAAAEAAWGRTKLGRIQASIASLDAEMGDWGETIAVVTEEIVSLHTAMRLLTDPLFAAITAADNFNAALATIIELEEDSETTATDMRTAILELAKAQIELEESASIFAEEGGDAALAALGELLAAAGLTEEAIDAITESIKNMNNTPIRNQMGMPGFIPEGSGNPFTPGTPQLTLPDQSFGDGGIVQGPLGSPQMVLAHAGETILPTHKGSQRGSSNSGGGDTYDIDINMSDNLLDPLAARRFVRNLEREMRTFQNETVR